MRKEDRILRGIALMSLAYCALAILFLILLLGYLAKNPDGTLGELLSEWDRRLPGGVKAFLGRFSGFHLYLGACFAATYAVVRAIEFYGLWRLRNWGRIFCSLSVAVYIPFEAMGVLRGGGALDWCSLALNLAIFVWLALQLRRGRTLRRREADAPRSSGGAES